VCSLWIRGNSSDVTGPWIPPLGAEGLIGSEPINQWDPPLIVCDVNTTSHCWLYTVCSYVTRDLTDFSDTANATRETQGPRGRSDGTGQYSHRATRRQNDSFHYKNHVINLNTNLSGNYPFLSVSIATRTSFCKSEVWFSVILEIFLFFTMSWQALGTTQPSFHLHLAPNWECMDL
jgi:hypothetical protein